MKVVFRMVQMPKFSFQEVMYGQMVRATDRHTSRLYRYGCRDGATAPQFWSLNDTTIPVALAPRILAISLPSSSLERDFCRRRRTRQKGPEDDISGQRPEIGDHRAREMAAKMAFLLASYLLRVSEDWVVGAPGLEPGTR
jgi:hypothetical protein